MDNKDKINLEGDFQIPFYKKLLLKVWPKMAMKILAQEIGIKNIIFDKLHEVFAKSQRVDIFPAFSNSRGFILVIDNQTALFFYQDGDKFVYDGFEMGEYEKGDVTIFDALKRN